jgi:ATP-dependent Clp protease ATP-binding subunit ClpA
MKNFENIMERALDIAIEETMASFGIVCVETALAETSQFKDALCNVTGNFDAGINIMSTLKKAIERSKKIDARIVRDYLDEGRDLPIRNTPEVLLLIPAAAISVHEARWTQTENVEASHLFLALCEIDEDFSIIKKCLDKMDIDYEDVFKAMVEIEAKEYKIDPVATAPSGKKEDAMQFATELTAIADTFKKPFIGREDIINRAIQVLCRRDKSNPVLVGEPGVGKTEITIGLAKMIANNKVPKQIEGYKLYSVDLPGMIAGTKYRGEFEARLKGFLDKVKSEKAILFFDEIHTIVGCGATSGGSMDASNILKPYLTEGNIKFIGATTYKEYKDNIEKDSALMRRFQKVDVKEPTIAEAIEILNGLKDCYGEYHGVNYTDEAIKAAVELTSKYVHERFLPDKAIDMIDEAGAWASINKKSKIDAPQIEEVLSILCKIPKKSIKVDEFKIVNELSESLRNKIFGQNQAIEQIVDAIKLNKSGLGDDDKPIASFLFVGPTGTGKTEICKQLAANLGIEFVRFDMSEYMEENSISKLIGTSAGYVGYENGGLLTEAIRKTPHCVLLLDEIEKAHPAIFKSLLQVMDYGKLTDNQGRIADFRNCIIIMTSNAGAAVASKTSLGFGTKLTKQFCNTDGIKDAVKNLFAPEFRNRLTKTVIFNAISDEIGAMIAKKELSALSEKLAKKGITANYTDNCINELVRRGISPEYGAREIQRLVNSEIKISFVNQIMSGSKVKKYTVDYNGTEFTVEPTNKKKTTSTAIETV